MGNMTKYLVIWFYLANYGMYEVDANSPDDAIKKSIYYKNKEVKFIVTPKSYAKTFRINEKL